MTASDSWHDLADAICCHDLDRERHAWQECQPPAEAVVSSPPVDLIKRVAS